MRIVNNPDYFATSGDPNLARAVSYTQLFTIFKQFGLKATWRSDASFRERDRVVVAEAEEMLQVFKEATPIDVRRVAVGFANDIVAGHTVLNEDRDKLVGAIFAGIEKLQKRLEKETDLRALAQKLSVRKLDVPKQQTSSQKQAPKNSRPQVRKKKAQSQSSSGQDDLIPWPKWMSDVRVSAVVDQKKEQLTVGRTIYTNKSSLELPGVLSAKSILFRFTDMPAAWKHIIAAASPTRDVWIHTPSVVVSFSTGKDHAQATGGHNISANADYVPIRDLHALYRIAEPSIRNAPASTRSPRVALGTKERAPDSHPGLTPALASNEKRVDDATRLTVSRTPTSGTADLTVHIEKQGDHRISALGGATEPKSTRVAVAETIFQKAKDAGRPLVVEVHGATEADVDGLLKTAALRSAQERHPVVIVVKSADSKPAGSAGAATAASPRITPLPNGAYRATHQGVSAWSSSEASASKAVEVLKSEPTIGPINVDRLRQKLDEVSTDIVVYEPDDTRSSNNPRPRKERKEQYAGTHSHDG